MLFAKGGEFGHGALFEFRWQIVPRLHHSEGKGPLSENTTHWRRLQSLVPFVCVASQLSSLDDARTVVKVDSTSLAFFDKVQICIV